MSVSTANLITIHSFPNAIVHIDADAFFTSVEQALKPELKGRPVVTGKERGIVACASYEAKRRGVQRPMRLFEARKICPELICLPSDYETYSLYSKRIFSILKRFTPAIEEYSIDEAFADLSGLRRIYRKGYSEIAREMKDQVQKELGLTVSVGLGPSKILAKLASKEKKPNGFFVVKGRDLHHYLAGVPLDRVCGFGPNSVALLKKKGIRNTLDYVKRPQAWVKELLGKVGVELWQELRGESVYPLETEEKTQYQSISKTKTFTPPSEEKDFVYAQLLRNVESAFIKLRRYRLRARRFTVFLRDQEFRSAGLEADLDRSTASTLSVIPLIRELFEELFHKKTSYRLTGVVLSRIEGDTVVQYSLFDDVPKIQSLRAVDRVIDGVNELYGKHTLHLGTSLWLGKYRQHFGERGEVPERKKKLLPGESIRQRLNIPLWKVKI